MLHNFFLKILCLCLTICWQSKCGMGQMYGRRNQQQQQSLQPPYVVQQQQQQQQQQNMARPPPQFQERIRELQKKSRDMSQYMTFAESSQELCNDLYSHACGNWLQSLGNLDYAQVDDIITVSDQMDRKINGQLQFLLKQPPMSDEDRSMKKFYKLCRQAAASVDGQRQFIKEFVKENSGLPDLRDAQWQEKSYDWIEVMAKLKRKYNIEVLISIKKSLSGEFILEEPKTTIMPAKICASVATQEIEEQDEIFEKLQTAIKDNLKAWFDFSDYDAIRLAGDIQSFEFELCKYMKNQGTLDVVASNLTANSNFISENRGYNNMPTPPPQQPPRTMNNMRPNNNFRNPAFTNFIQSVLSQQQNVRYQIANEVYFRYLGNQINKKASFAYYIMYRALAELTFANNLAEKETAYVCVRKVIQFFPEVLGNLYQQSKYNPKNTYIVQDLNQILQYIKIAFGESLRTNAQWFQANVQMTAQINEAVAAASFAPSREGGFINCENLNYWMCFRRLMETNARQVIIQLNTASSALNTGSQVPSFATTLVINEREIQVGWGLFQEPFYSINYPYALKFSSVGYIMAREMMKLYDEQFWSDESQRSRNEMAVQKFNDIRECFRLQVGSYFTNTPDTYRNGTQLREFIEDTSAVNIAFSAYIKWLQDRTAPFNMNDELKWETLPDLNLSNTQLFFVNYAQTRCAARYRLDEDPGPSEYFPLDSHTLERLNINGVLGNGYEFGRDFNCASGTEMNVADKCLMF